MVLEFDRAKGLLVRILIYFIVLSIVVRGAGFILATNAPSLAGAIFSQSPLNIELPSFNLDNMSFDLIQVWIKEWIQNAFALITAAGIVVFDPAKRVIMAKIK